MSESSSLYETQTGNGVFVIRFTDEDMLDSEHVETRETELCELFASTECQQIVLDFSIISFLNSTGLSLLITLTRQSQRASLGIVFAATTNRRNSEYHALPQAVHDPS